MRKRRHHLEAFGFLFDQEKYASQERPNHKSCCLKIPPKIPPRSQDLPNIPPTPPRNPPKIPPHAAKIPPKIPQDLSQDTPQHGSSVPKQNLPSKAISRVLDFTSGKRSMHHRSRAFGLVFLAKTARSLSTDWISHQCGWFGTSF